MSEKNNRNQPDNNNRLIGLTYVKAYAKGDQETASLIRETISDEELIHALASTAFVFASSLSMARDEVKPEDAETAALNMVEALREIILSDK